MQLWALICDTFRETRDKKLFWVMLFVSTLAALGLACIGFDENGWSLFFGAVRKADPEFVKGSPVANAIMGAIVSHFLVDTYIGWLGTAAALVATAGVFPRFCSAATSTSCWPSPCREPSSSWESISAASASSSFRSLIS